MVEIDREFLRPMLLARQNESSKRDYGHTLLVCGCSTMPGAAVLATGAALKSGCGLVTLHSTADACNAAVSQFPSAMISKDPCDCFSVVPDNLDRYGSIAVGPGLGKDHRTVEALKLLMEKAYGYGIPLIVDADAINIISQHMELLPFARNAVFTPHAGELARLLGESCRSSGTTPDSITDRNRTNGKIKELADTHGLTVVSKGYHSRIISAGDDNIYECRTGNPGMAKGGSGDVLTGLLAGLVARGYEPASAAKLAVWIHGFAGDILTAECTAEAYNSRDLIDSLKYGFISLSE